MISGRFISLIGAAIAISSVGNLFALNTPTTFTTINSEKGCSVRVGAWLSPSCTHCAEYFTKILPKITQKVGFCVDFHSLPHLYPLDMPIAVLVWSQGPDNAVKNATLFYTKQDEWLMPSVNNSDVNDEARKDDVGKFFKEIAEKNPADLEKIKAYIAPTDPHLYVKLFALKNGFSINHLERYLPASGADPDISRSLVTDLPRTTSKNAEPEVVKYSPAFTDEKGVLLPDEVLDRKILTEDTADEMLKKAGPPVPIKRPTPAPLAEFPYSVEPPKHVKTAAKKADKISDYDDDEVQDADDEFDKLTHELKKGKKFKIQDESDIDFLADDIGLSDSDFEDHEEDDGLQNMSNALKGVLATVS